MNKVRVKYMAMQALDTDVLCECVQGQWPSLGDEKTYRESMIFTLVQSQACNIRNTLWDKRCKRCTQVQLIKVSL